MELLALDVGRVRDGDGASFANDLLSGVGSDEALEAWGLREDGDEEGW